MKVFKKVFAFAIALTAIAMASSAMAEEIDATYNSNNKTVTVVDASIAGGDQTTVAVVKNTFGEVSTDTVADYIYYINQDTADVICKDLANGVGLKDALNVPANYEVRVGGSTTKTYEIPEFVVEHAHDAVSAIDIEGRIGFDGKVTVNGSKGIAKLIFAFKNGTEDGRYEWVFDNSINNISGGGVVTFGLEIDGVPDGATVTLNSVTAEAAAE